MFTFLPIHLIIITLFFGFRYYTSKINSYLRFPFHFTKIVVNIGEAIHIEENYDLEMGTDIIMNKIAELLPESLRGLYKG